MYGVRRNPIHLLRKDLLTNVVAIVSRLAVYPEDW